MESDEVERGARVARWRDDELPAVQCADDSAAARNGHRPAPRARYREPLRWWRAGQALSALTAHELAPGEAGVHEPPDDERTVIRWLHADEHLRRICRRSQTHDLRDR